LRQGPLRAPHSLLVSSLFALPEHKNDPSRTSTDEQQLTAITAALQYTTDDLQERLDRVRRQGGGGQDVLQRDLETHRLTARLGALRRAGSEICLGRTTDEDGNDVYVGRLGLTDADGRRVLVDWRTPAAEPFFAATRAHPMGLTARRRYRWSQGRITDYWDEVFSGADEGYAALDDQSAFIASLGASRSPRMRDVLGTIAADQDAIIRASSRGPLVVDGGPGTGKTVVALHRTAYLLYADPRLGHHRGGVLFVGPHRPYLDYVGDVLPGLGEEGVLTCTLADLVPVGGPVEPEGDGAVAALKAQLVDAIEPAVALYEELPDWAANLVDPPVGVPHNQAREELWVELQESLDPEEIDERREEFERAWPLLDPLDVVGDLFSVPAYLRRCAPHLSRDEVFLLQREDPGAWTVEDLPLLDAARARVGDPHEARNRRRRAREQAAERERRASVTADLIAADDSEMHLMSMLKGEDLKNALDSPPEAGERDVFAHVVVDEAQELTDAQWRMLVRRCPSRSFTIVGDRAQARRGFAESWAERLERVGVGTPELRHLTVNYRTPAEVMAAAEPVIRAELPDANVPTSVRSNGIPVRELPVQELGDFLDRWSAENEGVACVIGHTVAHDRVRSLTPELAKGLEFDLVVLVAPERYGAVDRYVAMTRATRQLVLVRTGAPSRPRRRSS